MKQYIITDEKLQQLLTRTRKNPLGDGHGSEFLSLADWEIATIVDAVYHHPYNPQAEREKILELLNNLRRYANGEYKEADLSDNEHDLRIHLEYENRIWGIMQELRKGGEQG